ncbi:MAG: glucosaminidase domain-containing protein [Bacteroidota bacterium]
MRRTVMIGWLVVGILLGSATYAQDSNKEFIIGYIEQYADLAIKEMARTGVPASIKLAQGIHESGAGQGHLTGRSNNHFGIKCKSNWEGDKVYHDDDAADECFRKYDSAEESYIDHSNYLRSQSRYAFLFEYEPNDHESWAWGLKRAGYATSPVYAQTIIRYIETYQLNELNAYEDVEEDETLDLSDYFTALRSAAPIAYKPASSRPSVSATEATKSAPVRTSSTAYPKGIFKINGLKVVYASEGTSLLSLAKKHKVQLSSLLAYNELPPRTTLLKEDQLVFLQRKKKTGKSKYHRVKKGEDMYAISQAEGIRLSQLLHFNKMKTGQVPKAGQKIALQHTIGKRPQLEKTAERITPSSVHVVRKGESLYTIAKKYSVTIDSIKEVNNLRSSELQIGQTLKIQK